MFCAMCWWRPARIKTAEAVDNLQNLFSLSLLTQLKRDNIIGVHS